MNIGLLHGGRLQAAIEQFGGDVTDWMDLSTGINPRPWPVPALDENIWSRLPEEGSLRALEAAARRYYCVGPGQEIVATSGSQTLIELLPRIMPGDSAAVLTTGNGTYGEHAHCLEKAGRRVSVVSDVTDISNECDLAVLVHPNNPDGYFWNHPNVMVLAENLRTSGGHVIVDEAFCDLVPERSFVPDAPSNMIIYRSFGKFFGLAGLRLGFAICSKRIAEVIRAHLGPWPVSGPAIEIGRQALEDANWIDQTRSWLVSQSGRLVEVLETAGLRIIGRQGLFVLAADQEAGRIATVLARRHVLVRSFPDRPHLLRLGLPGNKAGLERLSAVLYRSCRQQAS